LALTEFGDPQTVVYLDLENQPPDHVYAMNQLESRRPDRVEGTFMWTHLPAGIDLQSRSDRHLFEGALIKHRPGLVVVGPIGKMYRRRDNGQTDEDAVARVQDFLNDMLAKYEFALLLEGHAPHGSSYSKRDMRPYGSVLWMRWPNLGFGLTETKDAGMWELTRWRGDRNQNTWPTHLSSQEQFPHQIWPWEGRWPNGAPHLPPVGDEPPLPAEPPEPF
jgi:hypothetical protein